MGRRGEQTLRMRGWRPASDLSGSDPAIPFLAVMDGDLATIRSEGIHHHLAPGSIRTYNTGVDAFAEFALYYRLPCNLFTMPTHVVLRTLEYFVCYLRWSRHIESHTISNYLTHLTTYLQEQSIPIPPRNKHIHFLLTTWKKEDFLHQPIRLRTKIPLSADLMWRIFDLLDVWYHDVPDMSAMFKAALSLAYGLSLRPSEYLDNGAWGHTTHEDDLPCEIILGTNAFFKWCCDDTYYPCTNPSAFRHLTDQPDYLLAFLDASKNDPFGRGEPRCLAKSPTTSRFNCLLAIFNFLKKFPPLPNHSILSGSSPTTLTRRLFRSMIERAALALGLDPKRLLPHSLRVGACTQLASSSMSISDQAHQSHHFSFDGLNAYSRDTLRRADTAAIEQADHTVAPLSHLVFQFMTPPSQP